MEILRVALIIISAVFILMLVRVTLRRARDLSRRIDEYHEEQDAQGTQPGPINPYADMAGAFAPPEEERDEKE